MNETRAWKYIGSVVGLGLFALFIFNVWGVLIPFFLGIAISYLVYPLVDRFVASGFRQDRVVLVLYIFLMGTGLLLFFFFLPNLIHQAQVIGLELPSYAKTVDSAVGELNKWLSSTVGHAVGQRSKIFEIPFRADVFIDGVFTTLPSNLHNVAHWGLWALIVPFVSYFGLTQGRKWIDMIFQWTPSEYVESLLGLMAEINTALGGYVRGLVLESTCVGLITMGGLWMLGLDGFVFLGVITGILNIVPFMAPLVGGSLAILAGIFQGASSSVLFGIVALYVGTRILDDFALIPFVIGSNVQLHPILMLFAVLAGFEVGGILGLLFAIPVMAVVKVVFVVLLRSRQERVVLNADHVHI